MENRSDVSVVGRGTRIEGTVAATGALRVEGEVVGAITAEGDVSLTPEAHVEANIQARSIALAGRVKGTSPLRATSRSRPTADWTETSGPTSWR